MQGVPADGPGHHRHGHRRVDVGRRLRHHLAVLVGRGPNASTLNYGRQQTVPNAAVIALGADRTACAATFAPAYLLFDLTGWFTT